MKLLMTLSLCSVLSAGTYFSYTPDELKLIEERQFDHTMTKESLETWDAVAQDATDGLDMFEAMRVYTYLYVAQADAAALAHQAKGEYAGSLDPVSYRVLDYFASASRPSGYESDALSRTIARIVMEKVKERAKAEDENEARFEGPDIYTEGRFIASWIPWHINNPRAFWPPAPPKENDPMWRQQVAQIKRQQKPMTEKKKKAIHYWAREAGPGSGDWRVIANDYIFSHPVSFEKALAVRSTLQRTLYDTAIVCFGAKYHYKRIRPQAYDSSVHYEIEVPKHPSYPAGHSTFSTAAADVLSYYFPSQSRRWHEMADEGGMSRIWGGIHYPIDDRAGRASGKKVAQEVLYSQ